MSDDETFEKTESGASLTVPIKIGDLKKGDYAMLKGQPCKVMEIAISKTGKHGHAKAALVGLNIFNNNKVEDGGPTSHNIDSPNVERKEYNLVDIQDDGFMQLMDDKNDIKEDLKLPEKEDPEITEKIKKDFEAGKDLLVTTMCAMGEEQVCQVSEARD
mmetsp:Transcript_17894/g.25158  ORF Transcript_17894/g.25158 Transcript_17894/m.25158 type:complete len:159 (+) Transcript_17894:119-595(+)